MKVLQVNVDGWLYGRPTYVCRLSKLLVNTGVDCTIIGATGSFETELKNNRIRNIRILPVWRPLDRSIRSVINLYRVIKRENPDVVHTHGTTENIIVGIMRPLLKIPVVATYHTNPFDKYKNERSVARKIRRFMYELLYIRILTRLVARNFAYITVISRQLQRSFVKRGFKEDRIKMVYFGVDAVDKDVGFKLERRNKIRVIFVGRVSVDKGCDCLLRACKILAEKGKSFKLYLVGSGDTGLYLDMATELGIKDRTIFMGFQRDYAHLLLTSDFFVLPSKGEGLPISILEAMAYGLPIIATNVGGIPELIEEGKNGFLVLPGDEVLLADAMGKMIEIGTTERCCMGLRNRKKIEKLFSSSKMLRSYQDIYREAIAHSMVT